MKKQLELFTSEWGVRNDVKHLIGKLHETQFEYFCEELRYLALAIGWDDDDDDTTVFLSLDLSQRSSSAAEIKKLFNKI